MYVYNIYNYLLYDIIQVKASCKTEKIPFEWLVPILVSLCDSLGVPKS